MLCLTPGKMIDTKDFYVISVVSNPVRYSRRWQLMKQFQRHMHDVDANLITVELGYGDRYPQVIDHTKYDPCEPTTLLFKTREELWHKENLINLGIQYLTATKPDWKGVAWIDGDIHFSRHDIIEETMHQLQHYDVVQMFSHCINLDPDGMPIKNDTGFMYAYHENNFQRPTGPGKICKGAYGSVTGKNVFMHPGYAWAMRRSAADQLPILDKAILGAGDHHMALGLIGEAERSLPAGISKGYRNMVMEWQEQASALKRNVGYVPGTINHYWHGPKAKRKYVERWKVLIDSQYDPSRDVSREPSGIYRLNMSHGLHSIKLRDQIRRYFRQRHEDDINTDNETYMD